jgi:putative transposase
MARLLRVEYPGAIYHVTCRMIGDRRTDRSLLYKDDADRERFILQLRERVELHNVRLYLFVCMKNHFHLVFETPEGNCSKFMQSLLTAYTVYYNLRHSRHGHLFDGRFKAKLVDGDSYLLALTRYVHLNPVCVGAIKSKPIEERIEALRAYPWSSYPGYLAKTKAFDFVESKPLLAQMSGRERDWPKRYREFVETGLAETDRDFAEALKQSPRCIGDDRFRDWVDDLYHDRVDAASRPEDVSFRRESTALSARDVMSIVAAVFKVEEDAFCCRVRNSPLRAVGAYCLIRYAGLSQRDVAVELAIGSGSAVSRQLKSLPEKLQQDRRLRKQVKRVELRLDEAKMLTG